MLKLKKEATSIIQLNADNSKEIEEGSVVTSKLHAYLPTRNETGFMIECRFDVGGKTYSVLTYTKTSGAKLSTQLGGKVELTFRGISDGYSNWSPKFLSNFKED